jgi:protein-glutamine gamma-glutamyltransferase
MTLHRAFRVSAKLLTLVAFSALVGTGKLPAVLIGGGYVAFAVGFGLERGWGSSRWGPTSLSRSAWNSMLAIACLMTAADFVWGTHNALQASLYVLVFLMMNKLLTLSRLKDVPQLFAIGFLEFLSAAVLTVDLWYAVAFVVYLLTAMWALLLYHLSCEAVQHSNSIDEACLALMPVPLTARFVWTTNAIAMAALAVTSSIFMVMPRTGFGFFQQANGTPIKTSGFSEKVDLGMIGSVKLDPTLVMRVQFPDLDGEPAERMYLKGASFDHYTGRSWANTFSRRRLLAKNENDLFELSPNGEPDRSLRRVNQDILLEALDIAVLFGLPLATEIRGPFASLETDEMGGLWLSHGVPGRVQYAVTSVPHALSNRDRQDDRPNGSTEVNARFLQLPSMDPKVAELAYAVTQRATTAYEKVTAIKQHLISNYAYSLDGGSTVGASPLEDFLFTRKIGYCEHYATAMVVMLRAVGIPARLVTGFMPGEWNEFGHYYTVRQQDAHAWVEVWFPRSGWITFDPTPSVMKTVPHPFLRQIGSVIDSIQLKWDRFVIHYSFYDQIAVAQGLRKQGEVARDYMSNLMTNLKHWYERRRSSSAMSVPMTPWVTWGTLLLCLVLILGIFLKKRHAKPCDQARNLTSVLLYERMLRTLAARGINKTAGCTPLEFSARVLCECQAVGPIVQDLTALYYRARFGQESLSPYDIQRAEGLLTRLAEVAQSNSS